MTEKETSGKKDLSTFLSLGATNRISHAPDWQNDFLPLLLLKEEHTGVIKFTISLRAGRRTRFSMCASPSSQINENIHRKSIKHVPSVLFNSGVLDMVDIKVHN